MYHFRKPAEEDVDCPTSKSILVKYLYICETWSNKCSDDINTCVSNSKHCTTITITIYLTEKLSILYILLGFLSVPQSVQYLTWYQICLVV